MSSLKLDLIHAFGSTCSQQYHNCVGISEEDKNEVKVIFPVGKAIANKKSRGCGIQTPLLSGPSHQDLQFGQGRPHFYPNIP
jgi:hypothetical protein